MKSLKTIAVLGVVAGALTCFSGASASAKESKSAKKAESKMMTACKKEYPEAVKGKSFKEVAEWVETEERGAHADTFKKSKCYNLHEDWEKVAGHSESEEREHKS